MERIYLDNNATTQPAPQVLDVMNEAEQKWWANPSSVHRFGQSVRHRLELARASVARLIGAQDNQIIFTSGGTESNNLALRGMLGSHPGKRPREQGQPNVLVTTKVEHSAIREPAEALAESDVEVIYLPLDDHARIHPCELRKVLGDCAVDRARVLVSIQWANNETGVIQPMSEIAAVCRENLGHGKSLWLHTDATQAVGKIPVDVGQVPVDLLTLSAHKFHGPKGVGTLYVRRPTRLQPLIRGGPQEREKRGGTENSIAIIGAGTAAELAAEFLNMPGELERLRILRDRFEQSICQAETAGENPGVGVGVGVVNPPGVAAEGSVGDEHRIWNTTNIGFARLEAEAILMGLSERGVCASAGAACSSGSLEPSPVLLAMGIPESVAHGSIRLSLSRFSTQRELDQAARIVSEVVKKLAQTMTMSV